MDVCGYCRAAVANLRVTRDRGSHENLVPDGLSGAEAAMPALGSGCGRRRSFARSLGAARVPTGCGPGLGDRCRRGWGPGHQGNAASQRMGPGLQGDAALCHAHVLTRRQRFVVTKALVTMATSRGPGDGIPAALSSREGGAAASIVLKRQPFCGPRAPQTLRAVSRAQEGRQRQCR